MSDPPLILGLDFGPHPGFWLRQGGVHVASGHVGDDDLGREKTRYGVDEKNTSFLLAEAFEWALGRAGVPREVDLLVVEPAYGRAIRAAQDRGALMSRIAAKQTLTPPKKVWNAEGLKPAAIKRWATTQAGEKITDIHEAEAGRMALWGWRKIGG